MSTTVITGANRGIGLELARQCIQRGDKVFAGCRKPDEAPHLEALQPHSILPIDVGDEASVLSFTEAIEEPVSLLINNAGTSITNLGFSRDEVGVMNAPVGLTLDLIRINGLSAATVTRSLSERLESGSKVANITVKSVPWLSAPNLTICLTLPQGCNEHGHRATSSTA